MYGGLGLRERSFQVGRREPGDEVTSVVGWAPEVPHGPPLVRML